MNKTLFIGQSILFICLLLLGPAPSMATHSGGESGGEIWVDEPSGSDVLNPDATTDNQGHSIYVWSEFLFGDTRHDIMLRRFDAADQPLKDPVIVNTTTEDSQFSPRVAASDDGSFLVVWRSKDFDADAGGDLQFIRSQAFDSDANPLGTELLVNTLSTNRQTDIFVEVAALKGGGYVAVWWSANTSGTDSNQSIQARLIDANGATDGGQFQANSTVGQPEDYPAVTQLADGGFLVTWARPAVHGRQFKADGTAVGDDFQINTFIAGSKSETDVALGPDGQVLVVWTDAENSAERWEIRGRLFSQSLAAQGNDFRINTFTADAQVTPAVAGYGPAGLFVVWNSTGSVGNDNNNTSIQGRIVSGNNQFLGPQFQLNFSTLGAQNSPGIGGQGGNVAVVWRSGSFQGANGAYILGETWTICGIFCDSFE
jgi:hypothetical protein